MSMAMAMCVYHR